MKKSLLCTALVTVAAMAASLAQNAMAQTANVSPVRVGAAASVDSTDQPIQVLLKGVTPGDINSLADACGQADSKAPGCTDAFNKIISGKMTTAVKPLEAAEITQFWGVCGKANSDIGSCTKFINATLKIHIPAAVYVVNQSQVQQLKQAYFAPKFGTLANFSTSFFQAKPR